MQLALLILSIATFRVSKREMKAVVLSLKGGKCSVEIKAALSEEQSSFKSYIDYSRRILGS
jgi:hypothetical protein